MQTLYRKYRPTTFSDVIDQEHIKRTLQNQLKRGTAAHAYLFSGPRGVGKTTLARLFAKAVNCENFNSKEMEPCNACAACKEIGDGSSIDVFEIDAASHTGVDSVRENIIENVRFTPNARKYKIYIIDEAHMLSTSAFNALLKTLEEPPAHAIFILATTELHKVPETIVSRCQRFEFQRVNEKNLIERLKKLATAEKVDIDEDVLFEIIRHSDGCVRDAESLLGQIIAIGEKKIDARAASLVMPVAPVGDAVDFIDLLCANNASGCIRKINTLIDEGVDLNHFFEEVVLILRSMVFAKLGGLENLEKKFFGDLKEKLLKILVEVDDGSLIEYIDAFNEARNLGKMAIIPQLPYEMAVVRVSNPSRAHVAPVAAKVEKIDEGGNTLPKESARRVVSGSAVELELRRDEIMQALTKENASLPVIFETAKILDFDGCTMRLGFEYSFYVDKLNKAKEKNTLEKIISDVMGCKIFIVAEHIVPEESKVAELLTSAFGGAVVE